MPSDSDFLDVGSVKPVSDTAAPALSHLQRQKLVVLFLLVTGVAALVAGGHSYAIDNEVQFQTTRSLVQLNPELESVDSAWADATNGPYVRTDEGGYIAVVGIGHSIVASPFYAASRAVAQLLPGQDRDSFVRTGTMFTNSVVLGLLAVAVALLALELTPSFRAAWAVGLAYALGTYALPLSKTFFTELTSALFLTVAVLAALRCARAASMRAAVFCGFCAGFGVLTRASSAMFVPLLGLWLAIIAVQRWGWRTMARCLLAFAAGGLAPLAAFLFFNWWRFGSPTDVGYSRVPQSFPLQDGLYNHFFTPGKSMFLFAPIIVLGFAGMIVGLVRHTAAMSLVVAVVCANLVFFSRVPFWSGDAAWGARYQQIVLPLMCVPAVVLASRRWWAATFGTLAAVGFAVPALLGSLIYFNVFFIEAAQQNAAWEATTKEAAWQPFLGHAELAPVGIRDVLGANRPGEVDRGPYSQDPATHYGYFGSEPRIDFWWLWVSPMRSSAATYLFFVPILVAFAGAIWLRNENGHLPRALRRARRRPGRDPRPEPTCPESLTMVE
ncbi:MAG TPA: hypothetical protein VM282_09230 [Acidimicrobiales bacterium]|nr:hypothetical protein [Acidimicrobiales bacterium]